MNIIEISLENFKLIKAFHPDFQRAANTTSNKCFIDWNELMPVVEKIVKLREFQVERMSNAIASALLCVDIKILYPEVVEFIKWYNNQPKP